MQAPLLLDLTAVHRATLRPRPPFNLTATVHKPSHFPAPIEQFEGPSARHGARYWRSLLWRARPLGLCLEDAGVIDDPEVALTLFAPAGLSISECERIVREIRWRFDMDVDLAPFERDCGADPLLAPVLKRWRGMRVGASGSLHEMLIVYVLLQNATVRRTVQMMRALLQRFGTPVRFDGCSLYSSWPPQELAGECEDELRRLKVGYRARVLRHLSETFASGDVDEEALRAMSNEEAKRELLKLYGIGPASVWYLLFEVLHRYDALDYVSPWEQRIYSRLLFDAELVPTERIIDETKRRWGCWRMLAAHYLFEDLFWRRREEPVPWLEELIRL